MNEQIERTRVIFPFYNPEFRQKVIADQVEFFRKHLFSSPPLSPKA